MRTSTLTVQLQQSHIRQITELFIYMNLTIAKGLKSVSGSQHLGRQSYGQLRCTKIRIDDETKTSSPTAVY